MASILCGCNHAKPTQEEQTETTEEHQMVYDKYGVIQRIDTAKKHVYLVFTAHYSTNDNGYFENFDGVEPVLNTLKEKGVKGSFFPTGNCFREPKYEASIRRIIDEGHYLSAHSNHHLLMCPEDETRDSVNLVTADSIREDIAGMELELEKFGLTKDQFNWMIPPYEVYNQFSADALRSLGYTLLNPTQETLFTGMDWMPQGTPSYWTGDQILNKLWEYEQAEGLNGAIILIHAMVYPNRPEEDRLYTRLPEIIDHLRKLGYEFSRI